MKNFLAISLAAIAGANLRYFLNRLAIKEFGPTFPYGTLFINLVGSMIAVTNREYDATITSTGGDPACPGATGIFAGGNQRSHCA